MSNDIERWITSNGAKIPIRKGQTEEQATQEFFAKKRGGSPKTAAPASEKTTIKQQVQDSKEAIAKTRILVEIKAGKVITDYTTAAAVLQTKLAKNGGIVTRKGVGDIQVGQVLKKARAYIKTSAEIAALSAVPAVIRNGIEIATHEKHKGRDFSTRTIAGRVTIGGQEGIVAVVIAKTAGNRYKVHRILTPDGETLKIEKPPIN